MFQSAFDNTMKYEGGYSNHPHDRGGETFRGIARNFHPTWKGWAIVDEYQNKYSQAMLLDIRLDRYTKEFYKTKYWDKFKGDKFPEKASSTAAELFDISVNMGTRTAGKFLQRALNILNRDERNYGDLLVDGIVGSKTIGVINKYVHDDTELRTIIVYMKAARYIQIAEANTSQEIFIRGWLNRIEL
jgi:lysozyme family protein